MTPSRSLPRAAARRVGTPASARAAAPSSRGEAPRARGERTRHRVADALISLLEEGEPAPTAKAVAARAGVSVRLVFHHFADMDALYKLVLTVQTARHWDRVRPVDASAGLDERIERTVRQRAKLFDAIGPVRRAGIVLSARGDDIAAHVAGTDATLRGRLERTFEPELDAAGDDRPELLEALQAVAAFESWDRLRRSQHLSVAAARRVMARLLHALMPA